MIENFTQSVTIAGFPVLVSDMSIRESELEPITQIDFRVDATANAGNNLSGIRPGAAIEVVQTGNGRTITWKGSLVEVSDTKDRFGLIKVCRAAGEAELLTRRRFTTLFADQTASGVILRAMSELDHGSGISTSGVQSNSTRIGDIVLREETVFDLINRVSELVGWTWRVENGVLEFYDPDTRPAIFDVESGVNLVAGSLRLREDISEIKNLLRAECYEYRDVVFERDVKGCTQRVYGERFPALWELVDDAVITSPDSLKDVTVSVDPQTGYIEFGTPLLVGNDKNIEFSLRVEYQVRRLMMAERRDQGSIDMYGERHGQMLASDGGMTIESAMQMLDSELDRKSQPIIDVVFQVEEFGLRAGQIARLTSFDPNISRVLRVSSIRHTVAGGDIFIEAQLTSQAFVGFDAVPELAKRVENLEKQNQHPSQYGGYIRAVDGLVQEFARLDDSLSVTDSIAVFLAALPLASGGGLNSTAVITVPKIQALATGGGGLSAQVVPVYGIQLVATGGGSAFTERDLEATIQAEATGGGSAETVAYRIYIVSTDATGGGSASVSASEIKGATIVINEFVLPMN